MKIHQRINFKQPKYMLPLIVYLPILATGYFVIDMFQTEISTENSNLQTTEYINPELPDANVRGDGVGGKYENMLKSFGRVGDRSAVTNIERTAEGGPSEEYESRYTDEDLALLDAQAREQDSLLRLRMQNEIFDDGSRISRRAAEQQQALDEMNKALALARLRATEMVFEDTTVVETTDTVVTEKKTEKKQTNVVSKPSEDAEPEEVVKKTKVDSDFFNTIGNNEPQGMLITAIIDEEIKAVEGSRVRLRLLDDVQIKDAVIPKGTYLYANMSGFGSQRVKGAISSVIVNDQIIKINLSIYDTDGLEGLYVPQSSFRETTKEVASGALSNNMNLNQMTPMGSSADMLAQWGMQTIQNAYQTTSNAISKAIKKNKVRLKYGTRVYLINAKDQR